MFVTRLQKKLPQSHPTVITVMTTSRCTSVQFWRTPENWLFFPTDRFQEGIQNCTNVPRRKTKRAIRMIRLDNRDQTGESGCKTGIEWLSGHKNHKKSLKYRLLNTDYKVFTNITDLVTYHFTNSHVTIVTWITWHHIILHHFCFIWKFSILDMF